MDIGGNRTVDIAAMSTHERGKWLVPTDICRVEVNLRIGQQISDDFVDRAVVGQQQDRFGLIWSRNDQPQSSL